MGFKFQPQATKAELIRQARNLISSSKVDLVAANTCGKLGYQAWLVNEKSVSGLLKDKSKVARELMRKLDYVD